MITSTAKIIAAIEKLKSDETVLYGLELNHVDNAQWQFPIKYNIHRLGKDGQIILLGRDLQSISENQQRFVKAQIAAEESIEEKRKRLLRQRAEEERRKREQQEEEQVLRVSVERFTIPEVLFRPIDAGFQSDLVGLSQAIVQSVEACPECYRPALYKSVYLVGGVALLPNLIERLKRELRSLVPSEYDIDVSIGESPIDRAWVGAKSYFEKENYTKSTVSRQEWEESSKRRAYRKLLIENGGSYT